MSERDFEIGTRKFKTNNIDVFKQFHIVRRIAPILASLLPSLKGADAMSEGDKLAAFATPIMNGLSKLSDADANFVLFALLSSVEMQQPERGNWAKLATDSQLMFQDIDLPTLLQAAGKAFMFNLSGFFSVLPRV